MSNILTIPLNLAENIAAYMEGSASPTVEQWHRELRALLAAPVVERQAIGWITEDHLIDKSATTYDRATAERWRAKGWPVSPIYAEQPAPVAVVLPDRELEDCFQNDQSEQAIGFNRAIDKVKELNQ